jgi:DNA-directed RNA polymerase specialized sigma24 family protein
MHAAIALAGSRQEGEDLLQAALERLLRQWRRIESDPEGYLRRILYNLAADGWRRRASQAAGGPGAAVLGGTQPGRDRRAARLPGRNGEVLGIPRTAAAA